MPRPERPLEQSDNALGRLAIDLRALREKAGRPSYRALATKARYSATTLSDAAGGRMLPSLAVTLAYVGACGGDTEEWKRRWHALDADLAVPDQSVAAVESGDTTSAPYVGLATFGPADSARFFGRDTLTAELADRVRNQRFVAVFGASGAGKSSLLRAGLIARLRAGEKRPVLVFTPGAHPLRECATALATLVDEPPTAIEGALGGDPDALHTYVRRVPAEDDGEDLLLVVDQFEEVFTLCQDEQERAKFVAALLRAARHPVSRVRVVIGVRTDFYTHCARELDLVEALRDAQVLVGPMTVDELRSAITGPAIRAGATVESALLAAVVADASGEAGVLPLLSHALLETWRRRRGTTLTLTGYQAAGGITHAVAKTAELAYGHLDEGHQLVARALFLWLTALGDGTEDTKRRIDRDEWDTTDPDNALVLDHLVAARLVVLDHDRIEIAHEALIRSWPRLRGWLAEDREGLRQHRGLTDATHTWTSLARDPDALYRGSRLAGATDWLATHETVISPAEREFLTASRTAEASARAVSRRHTRRLRQLVALLSVLLIAAATTTVVAIRTQHTANQQRDIAVAQDVLGQAASLRASDPGLALQLTLAAYRMAPDELTRSGVLNDTDAPYVRSLAGLAWGRIVGVSQDGRMMATVADAGQAVRLWALTDDPLRATLLGTVPGVHVVDGVDLVFSPEDRTLFVGSEDERFSGRAALVDVSDPGAPVVATDLPLVTPDASSAATGT